MPQETAEKFTAEEEEVVSFFMDLIPILQEAMQDLKKRTSLIKDSSPLKNSVNFEPLLCQLLNFSRTRVLPTGGSNALLQWILLLRSVRWRSQFVYAAEITGDPQTSRRKGTFTASSLVPGGASCETTPKTVFQILFNFFNPNCHEQSAALKANRRCPLHQEIFGRAKRIDRDQRSTAKTWPNWRVHNALPNRTVQDSTRFCGKFGRSNI